MALKDVPIDGEPTAPTAVRNLYVSRGLGVALLALTVLFTGCDRGAEGRIRRVYALGRHPSEPNKNRIEAMLADRDRDVRAGVLVVMESIDQERATRLAEIAVEDPDGFVRSAAVKILGAGVVSDPELVRRLAIHARGDTNWQVRRRALEAIAPVDDPVSRDALIRGLSDSVRHVRRSALIGAGGRPGILPVDAVCALLAEDPDWGNRVEAAHVLGASGDPAAYPCLDRGIGDPNEFVRGAAAAERSALARAGVAEPLAPAAPPTAPPAEAKPGSGV